MAMQILDGTGAGYSAKVTDKNQIFVRGESHTLEHAISRGDGRAYTIQSVQEVNGNTNVIHVTNDSQTRQLVIASIDAQVVDLAGGSALPSSNTHLTFEFDTEYDSNGTRITPINLRRDSGNVAATTAFRNAVVTGTPVEYRRWFPRENGYEIRQLNGNDSILIGFNQTFQSRIVTDHTSGTVIVIVSFLEIDIRSG